jgi:chromosome segregation ATPase
MPRRRFPSFGLDLLTFIPGPLGKSKLNNYQRDILTLKSLVALLERQLNEIASPTEHQLLLSRMTIQRHGNHLQDRVNCIERQLNRISHELQTLNTKYVKAEAELSLSQEKEQTLTQKLDHARAKLAKMKRSAETTANAYYQLIQEKKKMTLAQIPKISKLQETVSHNENSERYLKVEIERLNPDVSGLNQTIDDCQSLKTNSQHQKRSAPFSNRNFAQRK